MKKQSNRNRPQQNLRSKKRVKKSQSVAARAGSIILSAARKLLGLGGKEAKAAVGFTLMDGLIAKLNMKIALRRQGPSPANIRAFERLQAKRKANAKIPDGSRMTRQRTRQENRLIAKDFLSQHKRAAMKAKVFGGSATIRSLADVPMAA